MTGAVRYWGVIPAAGAGRRFGGPVPKQYLDLGGRQVIEHSIDALVAHPAIAGCVLALSPDDDWWPATCSGNHDFWPMTTYHPGVIVHQHT